MAYNKTLKLDQLFIRELIFKDFGNRPISSQQILTTRGDGVVYFSNAPSTLGIGSFNYIQADSTFTYTASNVTNTLYINSGHGIQLTNGFDGLNNKLYVNATAPQAITVYDTGSTINFSNLSNTYPTGRTLYFAGKGDVNIEVSTNTLVFGSASISTLSSFANLTSTVTELVSQTSTQINELSTLIGYVDYFVVSTGISTLYADLASTNAILDSLSTFVYTTFQDDGTGHHNNLVISSIYTNTLSTLNIATSNITTSNAFINSVSTNSGYASTFQIGQNVFFDTTSANSTQDCVIYVSDGVVSTVTDYLHIKDNFTNVDVSIEKQYLTSASTIHGSTYTTVAQKSQLGLWTAFQETSHFKPITQQLEASRYVVDIHGSSTTLSYSIQNAIMVDEICAQSTLTVNAPSAVFMNASTYTVNAPTAVYMNTSSFTTGAIQAISLSTGVIQFSDAIGAMANISSLCVSTIEGFSTPIFTFDKINNRVGLNLGMIQPRATFDVSGVVFANNFVTPSDRRFKSNIRCLEGLEYLSSYSYVMDGQADIGVLADEVERIAPSCIYVRPDGFKAVAYQKLVPVLLSYIHDLDRRIKCLEN